MTLKCGEHVRRRVGFVQKPIQLLARWTKKHGRSFYGYKNHVNAKSSVFVWSDMVNLH